MNDVKFKVQLLAPNIIQILLSNNNFDDNLHSVNVAFEFTKHNLLSVLNAALNSLIQEAIKEELIYVKE